MPQSDRIIKYMREHGSITQKEAVYLGCLRLSARIYDLKSKGYKIVTDRVKVKSTDGSIAMIGCYRLIEEEA